MSNQQDHTEGSRPQGSSSLIGQLIGQLPTDAPPVVLGGTEQACLRQALAAVPDPRDRRGRRHELAGVLAMMAAAVLAGTRSFYAIGQWLADAQQRTLKRLGARCDPGSGRYLAPDEATLRRLAGVLDAEAFEVAVAGWLSGRVRRAWAARARRGVSRAGTVRLPVSARRVGPLPGRRAGSWPWTARRVRVRPHV